MKTVKLLKTCIDIYYYFVMIAMVLGLLTLPILLFTTGSYEVNLFDSQTVDIGHLGTLKTLVLIVLMLVIFGVYFYTIRLIKKTVDVMSKGNYFSDYVIANFSRIGKLFIICAIGFSLIRFAFRLIVSSTFSFGINTAFFILLIMGLFMMFLSEAFNQAKRLKNENDLTI
ncbi:DUF2975 domain-containing protein [Psychroserpens sp. XS_ASV72]|uniref:DUF2975 domain-containing protein n=1 Tax=Psychroserpens sp. XS_ASV72 TaxID=3241293 RepID=UPI0035145A06